VLSDGDDEKPEMTCGGIEEAGVRLVRSRLGSTGSMLR
jgi:hypothetical protein